MNKVISHSVFKWCLGIATAMLIFPPIKLTDGMAAGYRFITEIYGYEIDGGRLLTQLAALVIGGLLIANLKTVDLKKENFVTKCWNGKEKLWVVFWVYGIALNIAGGFFIKPTLENNTNPLINLVLIVVVIILSVWWPQSVWRCADNTSNKAYGILAKFYAAVAFLSAILILVRAIYR